ncbi:hypothetical protein GCM10010307_19330 [Streptomyces vastus]|uniref:Uncharacterized protein n=1 Tax=Streptomyces vastus TaxID=285451 RepID=A0ABN3QKL3_9ACTN
MSGDGGAHALVGHDHHRGGLVRAVGDQACGLLEENGHQASWGWGVWDGADSGEGAGGNRAFKVTEVFGTKRVCL